jgi:two-component sensor histidine kinase
MLWLALGGGAVFLLSLAAALYLARRLVRPMVALTRHANELLTLSQAQRMALARNERAIASPVAEIKTLREAIDRANAVQALLAREVDHRSKNLLSVVLSVVRMSRADDIDQFVAAVTERVNALARAHSLLAQKGREGADLMTVAAQELAAYADHVALHGPPVVLSATAVQPLSMLLHELATNATKYGALSAARGRVELTWLLDTGGDTLHLRWREKCGPPIPHPPTRRGFGTRVIDATAAQLGGMVRRHWHSSGLLCEVQLRLRQVARTGEQNEIAETEGAVSSSKVAGGV